MRFCIWFGSASAALFLAFGPAIAAWPAECRLSLVARLPMTEHGGHVLVPVTVNGTALNFIVDPVPTPARGHYLQV